jgi:hypothetical protein
MGKRGAEMIDTYLENMEKKSVEKNGRKKW